MRHRERIALGAVALIGLLMFLLSIPAISFGRLEEAKLRIEAAGYHCTTDSNKKQDLGIGFLVTREEISRVEVSELCKIGPLGAAWKGKVWVTMSPRKFPLVTMPEDAPNRQWGRLFAFGDGDLLEEMEGKLRRRGTAIVPGVIS